MGCGGRGGRSCDPGLDFGNLTGVGRTGTYESLGRGDWSGTIVSQRRCKAKGFLKGKEQRSLERGRQNLYRVQLLDLRLVLAKAP